MPSRAGLHGLDDSIVHAVEQVNVHPLLEFKPCKDESIPESNEQRVELLLNLVARDPALFLERYGKHLTLAAVNCFSDCQQWKGDYEVTWHLKTLLTKLQPTSELQNKKDKATVKNRRYTMLQSLIKEGQYFSPDNNILEILSNILELYCFEYVGRYDTAGPVPFQGTVPLSERLMVSMDEASTRAKARTEHQLAHRAHVADRLAFRELAPGLDDDDDGDDEDEDDEGDDYYVCEEEQEKQQQKQQQQQQQQEEEEEEEEDEDEEEEEDEDDNEEENKDNKRAEGDKDSDNEENHTMKRSNQGESMKVENTRTTDTVKVNIEENTRQLLDLVYQKFLLGEDADFDYTEVDNNENFDPPDVDLDMECKYFDNDDDDIAPQQTNDHYDY